MTGIIQAILSFFGVQSSSATNYIEDVFSTYLYTGTGSTQTITNGIDLAGKGGLVWIKSRNDTYDHFLYDTLRGATKSLQSSTTTAEQTYSDSLTAFNSTGFALGANVRMNANTTTYASWTFREQAKFFDVVTYTGDGNTSKTVSHSLGSVPGMMIIKSTTSARDWAVYYGDNTKYLVLNLDNAAATTTTIWNNTSPTSTQFTVGNNSRVNESGQTYVAYLFANNAGGFGASGTDNVISCGSFTPSGGAATVTLGYEPQFVILKNASAPENWYMLDTMRGWVATAGGERILNPNLADAESAGNIGNPTATGFETANLGTGTYIYIAIRRGPMKTPTSGTSVFGLNARNGTGANATVTGGAGVTDLALIKSRTGAFGTLWVPRLAGTGYLLSSAVTSETAAPTTFLQSNPWDVMDGVKVGTTSNTTNDSGLTYINYLFDRAPGFFDVVCYTGDAATTRNVNHNLGVSPEFIIIKRRSANDNWHCWHTSLASISNYLLLNTTAAVATSSNIFKGVSSTTFTLGPDSGVNGSGSTYVAYLFSSITGVSKVGGYTGTGTTLQVNCGFSAGARFVMIKRTDSTGDWYVWDSARGIVAGNDPYFLINSTAVEVTSTDYVDTYSLGFEISSTAPAAINANGGSFIFLAIA